MKKLKSLFLIIFLLGFSLPTLAYTEEFCNEVLLETAQELNRQCPMEFELDTSVSKVTYENKSLKIYFVLGVVNANEYDEMAEELKDAFLNSFIDGEDGELFVEIFECAGAQIELLFDLNDGSRKKMTVKANQLKQYL